jgi:hypothetical protein
MVAVAVAAGAACVAEWRMDPKPVPYPRCHGWLFIGEMLVRNAMSHGPDAFAG